VEIFTTAHRFMCLCKLAMQGLQVKIIIIQMWLLAKTS